ncbi:hypothetical protein EJB05_26258 [Eragrostis curvula]|uniref:Uncharacterized protein n=1 Tax=Eragrostis curvula TaxID=38414 RepID=A0A5J9UJB4_9POAL|nr:hypothetical protein EJB05_26258 [Eragrostis curvula]
MEVDEAEAALRNAANIHPNRPTLEVLRLNEDEMISVVQDQKKTTMYQEHKKQQEGEPTAHEGVAKTCTRKYSVHFLFHVHPLQILLPQLATKNVQ